MARVSELYVRIDWPRLTEGKKIHQAKSVSGNRCVVLSAIKDELVRCVTGFFSLHQVS